MSISGKDKLATLNRRFRPIEIESFDKEVTATFYYRRPTESEDAAMRAYNDAYFESVIKTLKDDSNGQSDYETFLKIFETSKIEDSIDSILMERKGDMAREAKERAGLGEFDADASEEDRKEYASKLNEAYKQILSEARDEWRQFPDEVLHVKATDARVNRIASDRTIQAYYRALIQKSLYDQDENGDYHLVFEDAEDVAKFIDKDTIDVVANKIVEEMNRFKNVPLK